MALLILDNGKEYVFDPQAVSKIKPKAKVALLFTHQELFVCKTLAQENAKKLKLLLKLKKEKAIQFFPVPYCCAPQEIVERFNRNALKVTPEGFYTEGPYLKHIFLYKEIKEKGLKLMDYCKGCEFYSKNCPGCFEVISGKALETLVGKILSSINPNDIIADIGCGCGFYINNLLGLLNNPKHLFLIDPKIDLLKELKNSLNSNKTEKPFLICAVAENLPLKKGSVGKLLLINSFSHFSNPVNAVSNFKNVLKKNSKVFLIESKVMPEKSQAAKYKKYESHNYLSSEKIKAIFAECGFELIHASNSDPYYLLIFKTI